MAKYGEGDKRWIVEDRPDGANVHNWHWSETDCIEWSRNLLSKLLSDLTVLDGEGNLYIKTKKVDKVEGEAYVNVRKGKIIPRYEINVNVHRPLPVHHRIATNRNPSHAAGIKNTNTTSVPPPCGVDPRQRTPAALQKPTPASPPTTEPALSRASATLSCESVDRVRTRLHGFHFAIVVLEGQRALFLFGSLKKTV